MSKIDKIQTLEKFAEILNMISIYERGNILDKKTIDFQYDKFHKITEELKRDFNKYFWFLTCVDITSYSLVDKYNSVVFNVLKDNLNEWIRILNKYSYYFKFECYDKLKNRLGVYDAIIECNELALIEFKETVNQASDPKAFIKQKAIRYEMFVNDTKFIERAERMPQLYILSVYQQAELFLKDFESEYYEIYNVDVEKDNSSKNQKKIELLKQFFNDKPEEVQQFLKNKNRNILISLSEDYFAPMQKCLISSLDSYFGDTRKSEEFIAFCAKSEELQCIFSMPKDTVLIEILKKIDLTEEELINEVGIEVYQGFHYYRLVGNRFRHSDENGNENYLKALREVSFYKENYRNRFNVLNVPNSYEQLQFEDFKLFSNIVKQMFLGLCKLRKPNNQRIAEIIIGNDKMNSLEKLKIKFQFKGVDRIERAVTEFIKSQKFGVFIKADLTEITNFIIENSCLKTP